MRVDIYHHMEPDNVIEEKYDRILYLLEILTVKVGTLQRKGGHMSIQMEDLQANQEAIVATVTSQTTIVASVVAAINGLTTTIADLTQQLNDAIAGGDLVKIQAAADALKAANLIAIQNTAALAAAVPANVLT